MAVTLLPLSTGGLVSAVIWLSPHWLLPLRFVPWFLGFRFSSSASASLASARFPPFLHRSRLQGFSPPYESVVRPPVARRKDPMLPWASPSDNLHSSRCRESSATADLGQVKGFPETTEAVSGPVPLPEQVLGDPSEAFALLPCGIRAFSSERYSRTAKRPGASPPYASFRQSPSSGASFRWFRPMVACADFVWRCPSDHRPTFRVAPVRSPARRFACFRLPADSCFDVSGFWPCGFWL